LTQQASHAAEASGARRRTRPRLRGGRDGSTQSRAAQRSATAAKEIRTLIGESLNKVQSGNLRANEAGEAMRQSLLQTHRTAEITRTITAASHEQSVGIQQVSEAIMQLDHVAQQNASLVEEASAAAIELDSQARELVNLASSFKTKNDTERKAVKVHVAFKPAHAKIVLARQGELVNS
jgi:methyl-accepting chemotaxis protein